MDDLGEKNPIFSDFHPYESTMSPTNRNLFTKFGHRKTRPNKGMGGSNGSRVWMNSSGHRAEAEAGHVDVDVGVEPDM